MGGRDFIGQHAHLSSQIFADDFEQPAYGGGLSFLGPFRVTHADVDPVSNLDLGLIPDGTIIWRIAVVVRELFTSVSERVQVQLGLTSGFDQRILQDADVVGGQANLSLTTDAAAMEAPFHASGFPQSWVGIAQNSAHLLAADVVGSNSAGIVDIYVLVSSP